MSGWTGSLATRERCWTATSGGITLDRQSNRLFLNQRVTGSSPVAPTNKINELAGFDRDPDRE